LGLIVNQPERAQPEIKFPRRDERGRVASATELIASVLALVAVGLVLLLAIDGLFTLLGAGSFGKISGWLAGILAVFVFVDDFRAWRGVGMRALVALIGIALGVAAGSLVNGAVNSLPKVFSGTIAVAVAALVYAVVWFYGVRWSASRFGDTGASPSRSIRGGK
jgi:hypothetical protein